LWLKDQTTYFVGAELSTFSQSTMEKIGNAPFLMAITLYPAFVSPIFTSAMQVIVAKAAPSHTITVTITSELPIV
jgi:hypothetical protein